MLMALVCRIRTATVRRAQIGGRSGRLARDPKVSPAAVQAAAPCLSAGGAHEGRCRQGGRAGRTARGPGTRSARQADGCRARNPRRSRCRFRCPDPRRAVRRSRCQGRPHGRAVCPVRRHPARPEADRIGGEDPAQGPGRRRPPVAAARTRADEDARRRGCHSDQPRRHPAHAEPGPDDGRPELAGERRRLQGGPAGRQRLRSLPPVADDGRRARPSRPTC